MTSDTTPETDPEAETDPSTDTAPTRGTLKDVSHTNPYTDASFGHTQVYRRGRTVVADGGRDPAADPGARTRGSTGNEEVETEDQDSDSDSDPDSDPDPDPDEEQLKDVDHTPPKDAESANRVHQRGREGRDESV